MPVFSVEDAIIYLQKIAKGDYLGRNQERLRKFVTMALGIHTAQLDKKFKSELLASLVSPFFDNIFYGFFGVVNSEMLFFVEDGELKFINCNDLKDILYGLREK